MEDAVRARDAAREALADIEPEELHAVLDGQLAETSMTPGVLTLTSARALDPMVDLDTIAERAAGVQLIYEGLRLTRTLAHDEPWLTADDLDADLDADLDILAADVLVSRGFYLLARTEAAAERAVETVRAFGRDQTRRESTDEQADLDRNLEADIFELAVVAGTTAVGGETPNALLEYAAGLARDYDGELPPAAVVLPETTADRIASLSGDDRVTSVSDR